MSLSDRYPNVSEPVRDLIARGLVPPPRGPHDPPDRIRDLRLQIAEAEASGDPFTVAQLNAQWLHAQAEGATSDWRPAARTTDDMPAAWVARDLADRARVAYEEGNDALGASLQHQASRLNHEQRQGPQGELLEQADEAEADGRYEDAGLVRAEALGRLREPVADAEVPKPAPMPTTRSELNEAIVEADARGDVYAGSAYRTALLGLARGEVEASAPLPAAEPSGQ